MILTLVQSMLLGAGDISQDSLTTWVVGAVMAVVMAVLGFLARNAFGKVETGLESLGAKLDSLKDVFAKADTRTALLEARATTLERDVADLRHEVRELSEGVVR